MKGWTHAMGHWTGISVRSRQNKDQSGLLYHLHYRDTWSPASTEHAQSTNFGLLVDTGWGKPVQVDRLVSYPLVFIYLSWNIIAAAKILNEQLGMNGLTEKKRPDNLAYISLIKKFFPKIFAGIMFTRNKSIILLQIVCESMIDYKVIFKSIKSPNDICQSDLQAWTG